MCIYLLLIVTGLVEVIANDDADPTLHVDYSQPLWVFVNLTHSIAELNLSGTYKSYIIHKLIAEIINALL